MLLACLAVASGLAASPAQAMELTLQDDAHVLYRGDAEVRETLTRIRALGVDRVRLTASWSIIAPQPGSLERPDFDASDPAAYPQANWRWLDRAVRMSLELGLRPMIDVAFWAPRWATLDSPLTPNRLRTEINPAEFAHFATAVARRYSGGFVPPVDTRPPPPPPPDASLLDQLLGHKPEPPPAPPPGETPIPLPRVDTYTLWNEPNLEDFVLPQWENRNGTWVPRSAEIYRELVYAGYPAIKSVAPWAKVLIGGTASTASRKPGVGSVPPLRFIRALTCVDEKLRPVTTGSCAGYRPLPGDGWAHHPYSVHTDPGVDAKHVDNVPVAGIPRLTATLRSLVRAGRLAPANQDLYITEYGYETNPPDPHADFGLNRQGPFLAKAEYLATRDPAVKMWAQFMLKDLDGAVPGDDWQSGLYFADGTPKPAAATFRMPTYARCVQSGKRRWVMVWGRIRSARAQVAQVEAAPQAAAAWRVEPTWSVPGRARARASAVTALAAANQAVVRYAPWRKGARYRMRWSVPGLASELGPELTPDPCPKPAKRARSRKHRRKGSHNAAKRHSVRTRRAATRRLARKASAPAIP